MNWKTCSSKAQNAWAHPQLPQHQSLTGQRRCSALWALLLYRASIQGSPSTRMRSAGLCCWGYTKFGTQQLPLHTLKFAGCWCKMSVDTVLPMGVRGGKKRSRKQDVRKKYSLLNRGMKGKVSVCSLKCSFQCLRSSAKQD